MIVAGVMSGTSADGIDVALVRVLGPRLSHPLRVAPSRRISLSAARSPRSARHDERARKASVADLARLNFLLGELYADAVRAAAKHAHLAVRSRRLPRPDHLSPGHAARLPRPQHRLHLADRRRRDASRRAPAFRWSAIFAPPTWPPAAPARPWFPSSTTCSTAIAAAGASCRTSAASPTSPPFPPSATPEQVDRLRHRPRQHGDRRRHRAPLRQALRPQRTHRRARTRARRRGLGTHAPAILPAPSAQDRRPRGVRARVRRRTFFAAAAARARKTWSPPPPP